MTMIRRTLVSLSLGLALSGAIFAGSVSAQTPTVETLMAQIAALRAQILALQQRGGQNNTEPIPTTRTENSSISPSVCVAFSRNLFPGHPDDEAVSRLQEFLKSRPEATWPANAEITGYYGPITTAAVQRFQASQGIVTSGDLETTGFGLVGRATRARIQKLTCTEATSNPGEIMPGGNQPPVINSVGGPTQLSVNQMGEWSVSASDPENGSLTYSINWGELVAIPYAESMQNYGIAQKTSFTHSYANPGTYTITFIVNDSKGASARTTISVNVGPAEEVSDRIRVLSPNGGETLVLGSNTTIRWYGQNGATGYIELVPKAIDCPTSSFCPAIAKANYRIANNVRMYEKNEYSWSIGKVENLTKYVPTGSYYIRICDTGGSCDSSDSYFKIVGVVPPDPSIGIKVISPNGEELSEKSWVEGKYYPIQWSSFGLPSNARIAISLFRTDGASKEIARGLLPSPGTYMWKVDASSGWAFGAKPSVLKIAFLFGTKIAYAGGGGYTMMISASWDDVYIFDRSDAPFSIVPQTPQTETLSVQDFRATTNSVSVGTRNVSVFSYTINNPTNSFVNVLPTRFRVLFDGGVVGGASSLSNFTIRDANGSVVLGPINIGLDNELLFYDPVRYPKGVSSYKIYADIPVEVQPGLKFGLSVYPKSQWNAVREDYNTKINVSPEYLDTGIVVIDALPKFQVVNPNGGETWKMKSSQNISWYGRPGTTVKLSLAPYYPPCTSIICPMYPAIAPYTIATGLRSDTYLWDAGLVIRQDKSYVQAGSYTIQICEEQSPYACDSSDSYFKLVDQIESIDAPQLTYPAGGQSFNVGDKVSIRWSGSTGPIEISLRSACEPTGTCNSETVVLSTAATGNSFDWLITDYAITKGFIILCNRAGCTNGSPFSINKPVTNETILARYIYDNGEFIRYQNSAGTFWREVLKSPVYTYYFGESSVTNSSYYFSDLSRNVRIEMPIAGGLSRISVDNGRTWRDLYYVSKVGEVKPELKVLNPNGGQTWTLGSTQAIKWYAGAGASHVNIKLWPKPPACASDPLQVCFIQIKPHTLAENLYYENASSGAINHYYWSVGTTIDAGRSIVPDNYQVEICDISSNLCDKSDSYFTVTSSPVGTF